MIITNNEEALRVKCTDVLPEEAAELILALEDELKYANKLGKQGIGLAAPQIGIAKKIAIVRLGEFNINLINAKIISQYDQFIFRNEGCLSFPGRTEDTLRYQEIVIDSNLEHPRSFIATGLVAVVIQHELDHLQQSLIMDHVAPKPQPIINKKKPGPNDPCSCGKQKKYKKCCGI